jgi:hypothetical protein
MEAKDEKVCHHRDHINHDTNIQKIGTHKNIKLLFFFVLFVGTFMGQTFKQGHASHYWPCHLHSKVSQGKRKNYENSNI